jgi:hypothetical protein
MKKVGMMVALAFVFVAALVVPGQASLLHRKHKPKLPDGLPRKWDKKIPIPPGAEVDYVKPPAGILQTVQFVAPGDYQGLIDFYRTELPKRGFQLGPQVKVPARKAYNLNFSKPSVQDTLSIYPNAHDPTKFTLRVVYERPSTRRHLLKLLLMRWRLWPKFWRTEKPPTPPAKAEAAAQPAAHASPAAK